MILPERVVLESGGKVAQPVRRNAGAGLHLRHVVIEDAEIDLVFFADIVIDPADPLILVEAVPDGSKTVEVGAVVGARQKVIQEVCREGTDAVRRDLVIREHRARIVRIANGRRLTREVAGALGIAQRPVPGVAWCSARFGALVSGEEKQPVFHNRTAQCPAVLIPLEVRALGGEEIPRSRVRYFGETQTPNRETRFCQTA